jgi:hypothetical protein
LLSFDAESFLFHFISKNIKIKIYRTIILPVLFGCETWSLTLREEHRLRVFDIRVLRRIFGPKRDEVTSGEVESGAPAARITSDRDFAARLESTTGNSPPTELFGHFKPV